MARAKRATASARSRSSLKVCPVCKGKRLKPEALRVFLKSKKDKTLGKSIVDFTNMSIREAKDFCRHY